MLNLHHRSECIIAGLFVCLSPAEPQLQSRSTGKERDSETGLDYFGARYYGSNMGRWLSPDWSAAPEPVPYADFSDPQTLNLYGYVRNNPLSRVDVDGHNDYIWQKTRNFLSGKGYKTDAQVKGLNVAQTAANHRGDTDWATGTTNTSNGQVFKSRSDKCNEFVSDTVAEAGKTRPTVAGTDKIPTAAQLADPSVKINGLSSPEPLSNARPGDVIAQDHGAGANGNEEGHAGIIVALPTANSPGQTASANSNQGGTISINDWGFRSPTANPNNGERNGAKSPPPVVRHPEDRP